MGLSRSVLRSTLLAARAFGLAGAIPAQSIKVGATGPFTGEQRWLR